MITKILSISDVITNSSSEVFVMSEESAKYYDNLEDTCGCITTEHISWDWILSNIWESDMICSICGLPQSEAFEPGDWHPKRENWEKFCEKYRDKIEENLVGYYFVDIEDHFENAWDVTEDARDDSIWSESRH